MYSFPLTLPSPPHTFILSLNLFFSAFATSQSTFKNESLSRINKTINTIFIHSFYAIFPRAANSMPGSVYFFPSHSDCYVSISRRTRVHFVLSFTSHEICHALNMYNIHVKKMAWVQLTALCPCIMLIVAIFQALHTHWRMQYIILTIFHLTLTLSISHHIHIHLPQISFC